jgi:hypothetical protein
MKYLLNKFSLTSFNLIALKQGYRFIKVSSPKEIEDAYKVYSEEAFSFPEELKDKVAAYKTGTINFVAYYKNTPVGMVRLANPGVINRPYELYGVDAEGAHYEIQSLVVRKDFREGTQFVMLGLFKVMYCYSIKHNITSWSSCGARNVYLTMRRLCKKIYVEQIDFAAINNPVTKYLLAHNIIETYFTMEVAAFEPWSIMKRFVKQLVKKWDVPVFLNIKRLAYDSFNYGCK